MNRLFDQLKLTPQERRLVVIVGLIAFAVLNFWFVWPHFSEWEKVGNRRASVERTLGTYQREIARVSEYQTRLRELESAGSSVVPAEQELDLARTVELQARLNRVTITGSDPRPRTSNTRTNQFFEEQTMTIRVRTGNEELVNFLVSLASTNSLIRVRDLSLSPNPPQNPTDLAGNITLIASYQKRVPGTEVTAAGGAEAPLVAVPSTNTATAAARAVPARQTNAAPAAGTTSKNQGTAPREPATAQVPRR